MPVAPFLVDVGVLQIRCRRHRCRRQMYIHMSRMYIVYVSVSYLSIYLFIYLPTQKKGVIPTTPLLLPIAPSSGSSCLSMRGGCWVFSTYFSMSRHDARLIAITLWMRWRWNELDEWWRWKWRWMGRWMKRWWNHEMRTWKMKMNDKMIGIMKWEIDWNNEK